MVHHTPCTSQQVFKKPWYVLAWLGINLESCRGHGTC